MYIASNGIQTAVILRDDEPMNPRHYQENLGTMVCFHRRYNLGDEHDFSDPQEFAAHLANNNLGITDIFQAVKDNVLQGYRLHEEDNAVINGKEIGPHYKLEYYGGLPGHEQWNSTGWRVNKDLVYITSGGEYLEDLIDTFSAAELMAVLEHSGKFAVKPLYLYDHSGLAMSTGSFQGRAHHAEWDSGIVGFIYLSKDKAMQELAMASDKITLTGYEFSHAKLLTISRSPAETVGEALSKCGYEPVHAEDIKNIDAKVRKRPEENIIDESWAKRGLLYKKDRTLYVFENYNPDNSFNILPITTFNPDLQRLSEENWKARAEDVLEAEVKEYDNYLQNEVYGYKLYEGLEEIDSCWGYNPGREDICDLMKDELDGHFDAKFDFEFKYVAGEYFDIEDYFANNDFPELRESIAKQVVSKLYMDFEACDPFPYGMSFEELRGNKDGVLDNIIEELYEAHEEVTVEKIREAIFSHAGVSRDMQPKISVADLEPGREYTAEELMSILKTKPSLKDMISGAEARQASHSSTCEHITNDIIR